MTEANCISSEIYDWKIVHWIPFELEVAVFVKNLRDIVINRTGVAAVADITVGAAVVSDRIDVVSVGNQMAVATGTVAADAQSLAASLIHPHFLAISVAASAGARMVVATREAAADA